MRWRVGLARLRRLAEVKPFAGGCGSGIPLAVLLVAGGVTAAGAPSLGAPFPVSSSPALGYQLASASSCPWVAASRAHLLPPSALASWVTRLMTLEQKASFVALASEAPYENVNSGIPSLCIPPLTLADGPDGIAYDTQGVTQLPAAIGVAASFNPSVAEQTGRLVGAEARDKGIDVVQGPELNLARVPQSGRTFEAYGEDPTLTAAMGTASVEGIQSQGVMADAKHLTAYNQETDRYQLDQQVSERALQELYDAPFASVVEHAHVASVMCSYGMLNGVNSCSDPGLFAQLRAWGFDGFIRSDLQAVYQSADAFRAGLDLVKPLDPATVVGLVHGGVLAEASLDSAVRATLTQMFAYGLIASPRPLSNQVTATSAAHAQVALSTAEHSMVLLKDHGGILPLAKSGPTSGQRVAVIGTDAGPQAITTGWGSSEVHASQLVTPLAALHSTLGPGTKVSYTPADAPPAALPPLPVADLVGSPLPTETPPTAAPRAARGHNLRAGKRDLHLAYASNFTPEASTAAAPGTGPGWSAWSATLTVPRTGEYEFSIEDDGDTWLTLGSHPLIASPGLQGRSLWSTSVPLVAHHPYQLTLRWYAVTGTPLPQLGFEDVSPEIAAAVRAARGASTAIVFVGETQSESVDRPTLELPGDADALISAVAAANPRTVVVLNSGGAVVMPWLAKVAAVLEAWYPGQQDGAATAAVLEGRFDPAGHLPVTFPTVGSPSPVGTPQQFPGVDSTVEYREGLDIGYRWYQAHRVSPQFPFGYGLSYTHFTLARATAHIEGGAVVVHLTVTNAGRRPGTAVVQAYLHYPSTAGEPPDQLRAFDSVFLGPSQARAVHLTLPASSFEAYLNGGFHTVAGTYSIDIGQSSGNLALHVRTQAP